MAIDLGHLSGRGSAFLAERQLATLTTLKPDGSPHVVPVGFTWDGEEHVARVITSRSSRKARNAARGCPAVLCQFEGRHWLALEGTARIADDNASVSDAERRYAARYREPRPNPVRVVIVVDVHRILGNL